VFAPVPVGVEILEGNSEVNIVADDGEMRYLECNVWSSASLKPRLGLVGHFLSMVDTTNLLFLIRCHR
jgi:hypothetical protein